VADDFVYKIADFPVYGAASSIPGAGMTAEGGFFVWMKNKTGSASVQGELVEASTGTDDAFDQADASSDEFFGVVYDAGVADGDWCRIVKLGRCQVLLKDTTAATRHNWVKSSDVAGRADMTTATPPGGDVSHWQEGGHCIASVGAGVDVLAWATIHHN
jgi:hypothetical protein